MWNHLRTGVANSGFSLAFGHRSCFTKQTTVVDWLNEAWDKPETNALISGALTMLLSREAARAKQPFPQTFEEAVFIDYINGVRVELGTAGPCRERSL